MMLTSNWSMRGLESMSAAERSVSQLVRVRVTANNKSASQRRYAAAERGARSLMQRLLRTAS